MKKYVSAGFMLEMVLVEGDKLSEPVFDLRDRNGHLTVRGNFEDLLSFFEDAVTRYHESSERSSDAQS